jgi:anti-anti-sigma regulatory factor
MQRHGRLILVASSGPVRRILEVVRLSPLVPIHPTLQQAMLDASPPRTPAQPDAAA